MRRWGRDPQAALSRLETCCLAVFPLQHYCLSALHSTCCVHVAFCNMTQQSTTQNTGHSSASACCWRAQAPRDPQRRPRRAAVIPTIACCYGPSHGAPRCGMALSQSVSRDLFLISAVGTLSGWVHKLGRGCGFGMHRWACIIATQLGADFGR